MLAAVECATARPPPRLSRGQPARRCCHAVPAPPPPDAPRASTHRHPSTRNRHQPSPGSSPPAGCAGASRPSGCQPACSAAGSPVAPSAALLAAAAQPSAGMAAASAQLLNLVGASDGKRVPRALKREVLTLVALPVAPIVEAAAARRAAGQGGRRGPGERGGGGGLGRRRRQRSAMTTNRLRSSQQLPLLLGAESMRLCGVRGRCQTGCCCCCRRCCRRHRPTCPWRVPASLPGSHHMIFDARRSTMYGLSAAQSARDSLVPGGLVHSAVHNADGSGCSGPPWARGGRG
jgi:hypothetical protein